MKTSFFFEVTTRTNSKFHSLIAIVNINKLDKLGEYKGYTVTIVSLTCRWVQLIVVSGEVWRLVNDGSSLLLAGLLLREKIPGLLSLAARRRRVNLLLLGLRNRCGSSRSGCLSLRRHLHLVGVADRSLVAVVGQGLRQRLGDARSSADIRRRLS